MKSSIKLLFAKALICAFSVPAMAASYGEVGFGLAGGKDASPTFQLRAANSFWKHEVSINYLNIYGAQADGMKTDGANLPTIGIELNRVYNLPTNDGATISLGGGLGYTMPNLNSGVSERADNDISWTIGATLAKPLSRKFYLAFSIKGFFFTTDSQLTTYSSHPETLSSGDEVEVTDVSYQDNRLNFNSVLFMLALRWR